MHKFRQVEKTKPNQTSCPAVLDLLCTALHCSALLYPTKALPYHPSLTNSIRESEPESRSLVRVMTGYY